MSSPTVFVTGAAAGIGRATALHFAARGYVVGAADIDELGLGRLAAEIEAEGGTVQTGVLDVTDDAQWQQRLAEFHRAHGRLDILINNAGILRSGRFEDIDLGEQHRMVAVNVNGVISGAHHGFPYLRETTGAQLVNLCSASAIYGQPELATYGATKSAVKSLTEALDLEWARHDIRVIAIWPLFVATGMVEGVETGSTRSLGVRLTAEDVAKGIWEATRRRGRLPRVHYEIGAQAKLLALSAKYAPGWAARTVNKYLTGS
ncbi:MAG TPA: SDR family oxidoreductase [Nocardia sp.]|uniref:SDR family oxidoreductase n=1 Tax=Nocardia TaxID=1817 RepID=UPI002456D73B|nr:MULTISPECIES: SDR family oxidoreductase [Nocardia]HLS79313.1 SDR family oxidoreductase [Nocardia sp.]